jgi:hypothetical protein
MLTKKLWKLVFLLAVISICLMIAAVSQTKDLCELLKMDIYMSAGAVAAASFILMLLLIVYDMYNKISVTRNLLIGIILIILVPWMIRQYIPYKDCSPVIIQPVPPAPPAKPLTPV